MKLKKYILPLFSAALAILFFTGCTDVIDLDLKNSEPRIILEGNLNATSGDLNLDVTRSTPIDEVTFRDGIEGATVNLTLQNGTVLPVSDDGSGYYSLSGINLNPGETLNLEVQTPDDGTFSAVATVPRPVELDTIEVLVIQSPFTNDNFFQIFPVFSDPAGAGERYRILPWINGQFVEGEIILSDDKAQDGEDISFPLFSTDYEESDSVRLDLLSANQAYHTYFQELSTNTSQGFAAATPFNPSANWSNDGLGYFGVWHISTKTVILEQ